MSRSESLPPERRTLRWILWLAAGVAFGVLAGFVAALAASGPDADRAGDTEAETGVWNLGGGGRL